MKVVIFCGGKGTRISEETRKIPKPMVRIGNYPILLHIMNYYFSFGVKEYILTLGYLGHIIEDYFIKVYPKFKKLKLKIENKKNLKILHYSNNLKVYLLQTGQDTETGGRLLKAKSLLVKDDFFYLTYGDGLSNVDINELTKTFLKSKTVGILTCVRPPARFGRIFMKGKYVKKFEEKNQLDEGWINGGFFIFNKNIFEYIVNNRTDFQKYTLTKLAEKKLLVYMKHFKFWQCMDTLREKIILNDLFNKKKAAWVIKKELF